MTRRSHVTQISVSQMDLALCAVTTVQLARHATARRKLAQRGIAVFLNEVPLSLVLCPHLVLLCASVPGRRPSSPHGCGRAHMMVGRALARACLP